MNRISIFLICSSLCTFASAQEQVSELVRWPAGENMVRVNTLMEAKKGDDLFVQGLDGKLYLLEKNAEEWKAEDLPQGGVVDDLQVFAGKSGELVLLRKLAAGNSIDVYDTDDSGETWELKGNLPVTVPGTGFGSDADVRSGNIHIVREVKSEENGNCRIDLLMESSASHGKKWDDPVRLNALPGTCNGDDQPQWPGVVAHDGRLAAIWIQNNQLYLDRSFNKGETWLRNDIPIPMYPGLWEESGRQMGIPHLAIDRSNSSLRNMLYLMWTDEVNGHSRIMMSRSSNFGDIWTPDAPLPQADSLDQLFPKMHVDASLGTLYMIYYTYGNEHMEVYLAYSLNGAQTFKFKKLSASPFPAGNLDRWSQPCSVTAFDQRVLVTWIEQEEGESVQKVEVIPQKELFDLKKK